MSRSERHLIPTQAQPAMEAFCHGISDKAGRLVLYLRMKWRGIVPGTKRTKGGGGTRLVLFVAVLTMPFVLADGGSMAFARSTSLDPNLEADQQPVDLIRPARPTVDQDAPHRRGNPLWQIPLKVLGATRERPLFSASRRPPAPPVVAAVYVPPPPPPPAPKLEPDRPLLTLVGTIAGHTDEIGIFVDDATSKILRLKPGQDFGGWVLLAIKGRSAEFKKADRTATLGLPARNETGPQRGLPVTPVSNVALNIGGGPLLATSPPQSYSPVGGPAAGGDPWMGPIDFSGRKNKK